LFEIEIVVRENDNRFKMSDTSPSTTQIAFKSRNDKAIKHSHSKTRKLSYRKDNVPYMSAMKL